jgi:mono/diheme cytochrome c family protein
MRTEPYAPSSPVEAPARSRSARPWLVGLVVGVLGTLVLGALVAGPLIIAKHNDLPLERAYGDVAVSIASRVAGGSQQNPLAGNPRALAAGRDAYTGSCAICHGASGDGRGVFGTSSYPNATDLTSHDAAEKSDAQLFWIIKNGLSFTGMPGFGDQYADQDIWALVSYVRALQNPGSGAPNPTPNAGPPQARGQGGGGDGGRGPRQTQLGPLVVPTPTTDQLDRADPRSPDAPARGAAVYFAQGCQTCHGAVGDGPANLALPRGGGPEAVRAVRQGRPGMPAYNQAQLSDRDLTDLQAYLATIGTNRRGGD